VSPGSPPGDSSAGTPTLGSAVAPSRALRKFAWRAGLLGALAVLPPGCGQALVARKVGMEPLVNGECTVEARVSGAEGAHYFGRLLRSAGGQAGGPRPPRQTLTETLHGLYQYPGGP